MVNHPSIPNSVDIIDSLSLSGASSSSAVSQSSQSVNANRMPSAPPEIMNLDLGNVQLPSNRPEEQGACGGGDVMHLPRAQDTSRANDNARALRGAQELQEKLDRTEIEKRRLRQVGCLKTKTTHFGEVI